MVADDPIIKGAILSGIFSIDDKPLLVTEKGGFNFMENGSLGQRSNPFEDIDTSVNVYSILQLNNGTIVLGTISNGIYQINTEGEITLKIN